MCTVTKFFQLMDDKPNGFCDKPLFITNTLRTSFNLKASGNKLVGRKTGRQFSEIKFLVNCQHKILTCCYAINFFIWPLFMFKKCPNKKLLSYEVVCVKQVILEVKHNKEGITHSSAMGWLKGNFR